MNKLLLFFLCLFSFPALAQSDSLKAVEDIIAFQNELNEQYRDREESPLDSKDFASFEGHDFFPINLDYRVRAKLNVTEGTPFFGMKTTTSRMATERIYGYVTFNMKGKDFRLPVYQSQDLMQTEGYADYLFFPFTDETNGDETYGGGRYLDLRIPKEGDSLIIDFNKAYNPYCAYNPLYSCPIVPAENHMDIPVIAGIKYRKKEASNSKVVTKVEVMPEYPGGYEALIQFIRKNLTYPKSARREGVDGTVYVQFIVGADGSISDIRTLRGVSPDCDREAERVIGLMPNWKPGKVDGKDVAVSFVLPIKFKL